MGSQKDLILIDTNVFVIDLRYKRDSNYRSNAGFLDLIAKNGTGFTTLINLLELCGILSFNLNDQQLLDLWNYFQSRYRVSVLPPSDMKAEFPALSIEHLFSRIQKKISLGDALIMAVAEKHLSFVSTFVTWDKTHFEGKFPGTVLTPREYVDAVQGTTGE